MSHVSSSHAAVCGGSQGLCWDFSLSPEAPQSPPVSQASAAGWGFVRSKNRPAPQLPRARDTAGPNVLGALCPQHSSCAVRALNTLPRLSLRSRTGSSQPSTTQESPPPGRQHPSWSSTGLPPAPHPSLGALRRHLLQCPCHQEALHSCNLGHYSKRCSSAAAVASEEGDHPNSGQMGPERVGSVDDTPATPKPLSKCLQPT